MAIANDIACDIHPLDNLRVLRYLSHELGVAEQQRTAWYHHWIAVGFAALETRLAGSRSPFCVGERPTWADLCLVPQIYNARRFALQLDPYPTLTAIAARCEALPAFLAAAPENQPDAG